MQNRRSVRGALLRGTPIEVVVEDGFDRTVCSCADVDGTLCCSFEALGAIGASQPDDAETGAIAARQLALYAAWALDRDLPRAVDLASRARVLAGDIVSRATIDAVQIYGGYGFVNDFPVEKLMRDARAFEALLGDERLGRILAQKVS